VTENSLQVSAEHKKIWGQKKLSKKRT